MNVVAKRLILFLPIALLLSGCLAITGNSGSVPVGPSSSSEQLQERPEINTEAGRKNLEVAIPIFDPNLPADSDQWAKQGIWPELRRAESKHFAVRMRDALEETKAFSAVRVVPDQSATGDIYILGKIEKSTGEDIEIRISVVSIDGKVWLNRKFSHRVKESFFNDLRNAGKNAYDPVFEQAAAEIAAIFSGQKDQYVDELNRLTEVRFGYSFLEERFAPFLKFQGDSVGLVSAPADSDPMFERIRKIRIRDQLFIDRLQQHFNAFSGNFLSSYAEWQKAAFDETKARREAKNKARLNAVLGVLALAVGVAAASNSSDPNEASVYATVGVLGGVALLSKAYATNQEAKFHHETLMELGHSIDLEVAPQVVEFEKETVKLTGGAREQFNQWRRFLKQIYTEEATPEIQL